MARILFIFVQFCKISKNLALFGKMIRAENVFECINNRVHLLKGTKQNFRRQVSSESWRNLIWNKWFILHYKSCLHERINVVRNSWNYNKIT